MWCLKSVCPGEGSCAAPGGGPIGFDRIMVATFALVGANNSARLRWFDARDVAWDRALVMITGRQGRPASGITLATNSLARIFQLAARGRLAAERLALEDPCQLLASGVTGYMAEQLVANDNDRSKIVIPGLDTKDYPPSSRGGDKPA